jgi:adenine-specific DNA-methyltransferase
MGAYFTLRSSKKAPLFLAESVRQPDLWQTDPTVTLRSGKVMAKAFAASFEGKDREAVARSFTTAIVRVFWDKLQEGESHAFRLPEFFTRQREADLPDTARILARTMGEAASMLDPLAAAYLISVAYTAMLPDEMRSRLGAYYTPPPLADRLVSMATKAGVNWKTCRVLDPACGGGAFLSAVAAPMVKAAGHVAPAKTIASLAHRLKGFEIDPFAAWLSQTFLEACFMPLCLQAQQRLPVVVEVRDSLMAGEPQGRSEHFDLVIGNPPYGRISLSVDVRARFKRSLYGHANLYGVFTDLAVQFAKTGGVIGYVTPTSFLAGEYFKALRLLLASSARPINIDFVSVRKGVFDDALQETMLATYRKTGVYLHQSTVHFIAPTEDDKITVEGGGEFELSQNGGPWLVPRTQEQAALVAALRTMPHRLRDYGYEISTGPLVWNRHKEQLAAKPNKQTFPLIWAEAISSGGKFQFRADKRNHAPYFMPMDGDEWLVTRKPCVLLQRTTAKEQSRRLIAAELPQSFIQAHGAVVIENHLNMIRPVTDNPAVPAAIITALLNSSIVDRAFRCISGSVAVSAYELENLPLPDPRELRALLGRRTSRESIERACLELYAVDGEA